VLARIVTRSIFSRRYPMADGEDNGRFKQGIPDDEFVPGPRDETSEVDDAGFEDDEDVDAGEEGEEGDDSVGEN
jgi:hypothetical protein